MSNRSFTVSLFVAILAVVSGAFASAVEYKGPIKLLATKNGETLYSLNMDAKEIAVVSTPNAAVERTIPLPGTPNDMCLSVDEKTMYVGYGD